MEKKLEKYLDLKSKRDFFDKEARDYIKENSTDAKKRASDLSKSHVRLLKFLRSSTENELKHLTKELKLPLSKTTNQLISKLMAIFDYRSEDK
ncbi:MAG: hypothetical protein COB02_18375 [Candidatus Cloacimonadota bacterium]|nr:MAG: hypothetical protein COB02_18375 [Candidatus Cloacimonadota bacterium]